MQNIYLETFENALMWSACLGLFLHYICIHYHIVWSLWTSGWLASVAYVFIHCLLPCFQRSDPNVIVCPSRIAIPSCHVVDSFI